MIKSSRKQSEIGNSGWLTPCWPKETHSRLGICLQPSSIITSQNAQSRGHLHIFRTRGKHSNTGRGLLTLLLHLPPLFHPTLWRGWSQVCGHLWPRVLLWPTLSYSHALDALPPGQVRSSEDAYAGPRCYCGLLGQGNLGCHVLRTWSRKRESHRLQLDTSLPAL